MKKLRDLEEALSTRRARTIHPLAKCPYAGYFARNISFEIRQNSDERASHGSRKPIGSRALVFFARSVIHSRQASREEETATGQGKPANPEVV